MWDAVITAKDGEKKFDIRYFECQLSPLLSLEHFCECGNTNGENDEENRKGNQG